MKSKKDHKKVTWKRYKEENKTMDGKRKVNREARKEYSKTYYRNHTDTVSAYQSFYRAEPENKEKAQRVQKKWRENNPEKINGYKEKYKKLKNV